jgi:tRNA(Ser,Leu) C12 N-acetylase TAN1
LTDVIANRPYRFGPIFSPFTGLMADVRENEDWHCLLLLLILACFCHLASPIDPYQQLPAAKPGARCLQRSSLVEDWNIIVTIYQQGFRRAMRALQNIGPTDRTPYYNVLVMKIDEPIVALETIERLTEERPALYDAIARVAPAGVTFEFQSPEGFKDCTESFLLRLLPKLVGRSVHVRLHRRGSNLICGHGTERLFNDFIVTETGKSGTAARITFSEPDAVIVIDTVDDRAGIAMWTDEDLARHRLLRPD